MNNTIATIAAARKAQHDAIKALATKYPDDADVAHLVTLDKAVCSSLSNGLTQHKAALAADEVTVNAAIVPKD